MSGFAEDRPEPYEVALDKAAFLRWVRGREGRYELKDNRIVMITGGSKNHARVTQRIAHALAKQLDPEAWVVTTADLAVDIGPDVRSPDVLVEPLDADGRALSTSRPVLIAEVLSPSSIGAHMTTKAGEYLSLGTLQSYLGASQDDPIVWLWQRDAQGQFPRVPTEVAGRAARIEIAGLVLELALADISRGIGSLT